jgi:hypothetical protein
MGAWPRKGAFFLARFGPGQYWHERLRWNGIELWLVRRPGTLSAQTIERDRGQSLSPGEH